jgi:hypothetical protein
MNSNALIRNNEVVNFLEMLLELYLLMHMAIDLCYHGRYGFLQMDKVIQVASNDCKVIK